MNTFNILRVFSTETPYAYASIRGGTVVGSLVAYPYTEGRITGTILIVEAEGLPDTGCEQGLHGVMIHEGSHCEGDGEIPFSSAGAHYNIGTCPHPFHTGDLPPLYSKDGHAWMAVFTAKFTPDEIIGRTIVIHRTPESVSSSVETGGSGGQRIACGEIIELYR